MIFKVSEKCRGSISLSSVKNILTSGMVVSIDESKLLYGDVKSAIKSGILIPLNEEEYKDKYSSKESSVLVKNKSSKTLVLGDIVIKPLSVAIVDKNIVKEELFFNAIQSGLVEIVPEKEKSKVIPEKEETADDKKESEIQDQEDMEEVSVDEIVHTPDEENRDVSPTVWDFRSQQSVKAELVPKSDGIVEVDKEEENADDIFSPDKNKEQPIAQEKKKRGRPRKDKEENTTKNKKDNIIKPVGEKRIEKTAAEATVDLDSRGQPVKKASDYISPMIDALIGKEDTISFVDKEQEIDRVKKRFDKK